MRTYKTVAVLGGGLYKDGRTFRPATYEHSDAFGMLGGHMRVAAAVGMYSLRRSSNFLFSGGKSAKLVEAHGHDVPVEAQPYSDAFRNQVSMLAHDPDYEPLFAELTAPTIALETDSPNTVSNMRRIGQLATTHGLGPMAVITNDFHIERAKAWWNEINVHMTGACVDFLSAEAVATEAFPGMYEAEIEHAYHSPAGRTRLQHEANGLRDIQSGVRIVGEFQLAGRALAQ